jgi:hypothetical protein
LALKIARVIDTQNGLEVGLEVAEDAEERHGTGHAKSDLAGLEKSSQHLA